MSIVPGRGEDAKFDLLRRYCEVGWKIFPTWWTRDDGSCACVDGHGCDRPGKHPRIRWRNPEPGRSGATGDVDIVVEWHRTWPYANWAVTCEDFFAVDVDRKHGGMDTLANVELNLPELLDVTLTQETSDGGRQLLYRRPEDVTTLGQDRFGDVVGLPGFEVKGGAGSYVLVPPSRGRRWLHGGLPSDATPALLALVRRANDVARRVQDGDGLALGEAFSWERALTPGAVDHDQTDTLYRAALSLRSMEVGDRLAVPVLRAVVRCFVNLVPGDPWQLERADQKWDDVKRRYPAGSRNSRDDRAQRWLDRRRERENGELTGQVGKVTIVKDKR